MALVTEIDYGTPESKAGKQVSLTVDGRNVTVPEGTSIMRASMEAGVEIPKLCATDMLDSFGSCRVCLVEIEGRNGTPASCTTPVGEGMVVHTQSERLSALRRGVMELYASDHAIGRGEVIEAEGFRQEGPHIAPRRFDRGVLKFRESVEMGLADTEGGRDLLTDRQPLAYPVVLLRLFGGLPAVDAGDHGWGDEVALQRERRPCRDVGDGLARHGSGLSRHQYEQADRIRRQHGLHCDARGRA